MKCVIKAQVVSIMCSARPEFSNMNLSEILKFKWNTGQPSSDRSDNRAANTKMCPFPTAPERGTQHGLAAEDCACAVGGRSGSVGVVRYRLESIPQIMDPTGASSWMINRVTRRKIIPTVSRRRNWATAAVIVWVFVLWMTSNGTGNFSF